MSWIWLDEREYPCFAENFPNINSVSDEDKKKYSYCVASFKKEYSGKGSVKSAKLRVSADVFFKLFINGEFIGMGPAASGGDFLCTGNAPKHYINNYAVEINSDRAEIFALVRLLPDVLTDYGTGHGGFMLDGELIYEDGSTEKIATDSDWDCRPESAYCSMFRFDSSNPEYKWGKAVNIPDTRNTEDAPIPMLSFKDVYKAGVTLAPGESKEIRTELDRIYGAYPCVSADGRCCVELGTSELPGQKTTDESINFAREGEYRSFRMHSVGTVVLKLANTGEKAVNISVTLTASMYPVEREGLFRCSDEELNKVYDVCLHTLKICRQTLHLDSTSHQELLACTGDYYIESLISLYAFGDMRLSSFDLMRTADWLNENNGRMFHTTYSLIWVRMLHDVYMMTGNKALLEYCLPGMKKLFARFETYIGGSGVIETPPDFMFVDWTVIDGYNMHHPPKALGQTVLNAFYYEALNKGAEIYGYLGENERRNEYIKKAEVFKDCFNNEFWDDDYQLFFDGKGDDFGGDNKWLPENTGKRYFSKYPNILAVLYGLIDGDDAKDLIIRIINEPGMQDIQPYFMHYMIGAVRKTGLFGRYGKELTDRWKPIVAECDKGLKEGWIAPDKSYSFDHSHAWGGTVAYQLPSAVSGLEILEPGMKKIRLSPCLYWLESAEISIPVQDGEIYISLKQGREPTVKVPKGISLID